MTNNSTKTYLVAVIERALAYYEVEAADARAAAEHWEDGEFHDRDDEALDTEGPSGVRERQPDGTWRKVPESEWRVETPSDTFADKPRPIDKQLTSSGMFHTPGFFRALQHDYRIHGEPRRRAVKILSEGYGLPPEEAEGLLSGTIATDIDDDEGTVSYVVEVR